MELQGKMVYFGAKKIFEICFFIIISMNSLIVNTLSLQKQLKDLEGRDLRETSNVGAWHSQHSLGFRGTG